MASTSSCTIGLKLEDKCNKTIYTKEIGLIDYADFTDEEKQLLLLRTQIKEILNTCYHHKYTYLTKYSILQRKCADPFKIHKTTCKGSLREITLDLYNVTQSKNINVVPGQKVCPTCRIKLLVEEQEESEEESSSTDASDEIDDIENVHTIEKDRNDISECFLAVGISPLKVHSQALPSRISLGKRKMNTAFYLIQEKVARTLNVTPEEIDLDTSAAEDTELHNKAENLDRLMELIREKIKTITGNKELIQVLTLAPLNWSIKRVTEYFNVTEYAARKSRILTKEKGILALPTSKRGKTLSQETINLVHRFFEDDEYSRQMPGMKDYVSISRNVHKQKRLILSNLNELYANFKTRYPDTKLGFQNFVNFDQSGALLQGLLEPIQCVFVRIIKT